MVPISHMGGLTRSPAEGHTAHRWPKPQTTVCVFPRPGWGPWGPGGQGPGPIYLWVPMTAAGGRLWPAWMPRRQPVFGSQGWERPLCAEPHSCYARADGAVFWLPCVNSYHVAPSSNLSVLLICLVYCVSPGTGLLHLGTGLLHRGAAGFWGRMTLCLGPSCILKALVTSLLSTHWVPVAP